MLAYRSFCFFRFHIFIVSGNIFYRLFMVTVVQLVLCRECNKGGERVSEREILEQILTNQMNMQSDMNDMKADITGMKAEMQDMKADITGMKAEMQDMKADITSLKSDVSGMKEHTRTMQSSIDTLKSELKDTKEKVTDIRLYLENTIERNIRIIAEGHLGLNAKMDYTIQKVSTIENRYDMLGILVYEHEYKLKKIV